MLPMLMSLSMKKRAKKTTATKVRRKRKRQMLFTGRPLSVDRLATLKTGLQDVCEGRKKEK